MPPLTAAELAQHPEFEHVVWDLKPTQAGKVSVGQGRGGPLDISYEIHGKGRRRMVVSITPVPIAAEGASKTIRYAEQIVAQRRRLPPLQNLGGYIIDNGTVADKTYVVHDGPRQPQIRMAAPDQRLRPY